jgi:hypothetical protein
MSRFSDRVDLDSLRPINVGLSSASESTMISLLGRPTGNVTAVCDDSKASQAVKRLLVTDDVGPFRVTGIKPAVSSLRAVFREAQQNVPALAPALESAGMLCVRLRKPTGGQPSTKLSNHSWGTAIDLTIDGETDTKPDGRVPLGIAVLIPIFNRFGWFAGAGFAHAEDDTHFEVAEETMHAWAAAGLLVG